MKSVLTDPLWPIIRIGPGTKFGLHSLTWAQTKNFFFFTFVKGYNKKEKNEAKTGCSPYGLKYLLPDLFRKRLQTSYLYQPGIVSL